MGSNKEEGSKEDREKDSKKDWEEVWGEDWELINEEEIINQFISNTEQVTTKNPSPPSEENTCTTLIPYQSTTQDNKLNESVCLWAEKNKLSWWEYLQYPLTFYSLTVGMRYLIDRPWWSHIIPGLIISAIPMQDWDHDQKILADCQERGMPLGQVISCLREDELLGKGLRHTPVSPETWLKHKVKHTLVEMIDFGGDNVPIEQLSVIADEMKATIDAGKSVLVHCKAGRGRSMVVGACYLIKHENMTPNQAVAKIWEERPEISPSRRQFELIDAFGEYCRPGIPKLINNPKQKQIILYDTKEKPVQIKTSRHWLDNVIWFFRWVGLMTPFEKTYQNVCMIQQASLQGLSTFVQSLDNTTAKVLHDALVGNEPPATHLLMYNTVYNAGVIVKQQSQSDKQKNDSEHIPEERVMELTTLLDKKLKL